jgi:hypothetical protein
MMKVNKWLILAALSVSLFAVAGCGENKTIYENGADTGSTDTGSTISITPKAFTFASKSDVPLSSIVTSDSITVSGISQAVPISVTGGSYSIDTGSFTVAAGTVNNGQTVRVQHTASALNSAKTTTGLTISTVTSNFVSTTIAGVVSTDGAALYLANCVCHGTDKASTTVVDKTVPAIQAAIAGATGGMGTKKLLALTQDQLSAISNYLLTP